MSLSSLYKQAMSKSYQNLLRVKGKRFEMSVYWNKYKAKSENKNMTK